MPRYDTIPPEKFLFLLYAETLSLSLSLSLSRRKYHKGFTLVELMIVIAIIALLAVALLPKLTGAQAKARDTKKIAELRDLSAGLQGFYGDYGTYKIPGVGHLWYGEGVANYVDPSIGYYKSMSDTLKDMGYLDKDRAFATATGPQRVQWNVEPCNVQGSGRDFYFLYFTEDRYSLSAYLETAIDASKIEGTFNWDGSNGTCTVYGRNYAIGN